MRAGYINNKFTVVSVRVITGPSLQKYERDLKQLEAQLGDLQGTLLGHQEERVLQVNQLTEQFSELTQQLQSMNDDVSSKFQTIIDLLQHQPNAAVVLSPPCTSATTCCSLPSAPAVLSPNLVFGNIATTGVRVGADHADSWDKHLFLVQTRERPPGGQYEPPCFTGYYILDVLSGGVSTLPCTVQDLCEMSCMMALGSRIYIVGMPIHNSNAKKPSPLYFLDFTANSSEESNCWKRGPPPIRPMGFPVAFGGKIYYFGISDLQVFYPPTQQRTKPNWRLIKSTPVKSRWLIPPVLADHKNDRIIAFFDKPSSMYAYYPSREQWECLQEGFPCWLRYCEMVTLLDGVIYVHHLECKNIFTAYDIATKQWLNVQVSPDAGDVKSHLPFYSYNALVSLGNDILCLLASRRQTDPENPTTLVHFVRFKVQLIINEDNTTKAVLVTPLSSQYFDLDSACTLHSCIAL